MSNNELESAASFAAIDSSQASQAEAKRAKSSMTAFKGHVTAKVNQMKNMVKQLELAAIATPRNTQAAHRLAVTCQEDLGILMKADMKHQLAVNAYLEAGEGNAEADEEFYQKVASEREKLGEEVKVLYNQAVSAICKCPAPSVTSTQAASSPVVKPEKELKPDVKLEEGDSTDVYNTWLSQFKTYFQQSNFGRAEPTAQRVFLSKCLDPALWKRLSGGSQKPRNL